MSDTMPNYVARKRFEDLSCAHRVWRGSERLRVLHGYARTVEIALTAASLDSAGAVVDFSGMKSLKALLEAQFDHTLLVANDDPARQEFLALQEVGAANVRLMDDVGLEGSARWVADHVTEWLDKTYAGRVRLIDVIVEESSKNSVQLVI